MKKVNKQIQKCKQTNCLLFFTDVTVDPGRVSGFYVNSVHLEHVSLHKILITKFFLAYVTITSRQAGRLSIGIFIALLSSSSEDDDVVGLRQGSVLILLHVLPPAAIAIVAPLFLVPKRF